MVVFLLIGLHKGISQKGNYHMTNKLGKAVNKWRKYLVAEINSKDEIISKLKEHSDMQHEGLRQAIDKISRLEAALRKAEGK
jgi:hypothetical protein